MKIKTTKNVIIEISEEEATELIDGLNCYIKNYSLSFTDSVENLLKVLQTEFPEKEE